MKDKLTLRPTPNDGESSFKIEINGEGIGQIYNEESDVTYEGAIKYGKKIELSFNAHDDLVKTLTALEDIISGIEAEADNKGIDLSEARHWWVDARKLLDKIEDQQNQTT